MDKDLNGILNLLLLSKIAENLDQTQKIKTSNAKKIICYLKESNKSKNINSSILQVTLENQNILNYSKYIDSTLSINDINDLIALLDIEKQNEIKILWKTLLEFKGKSETFEEDFSQALSKSYFEFFPFEVYFNTKIDLKKYIEGLDKCQSLEIKTLFNGCRNKAILEKLEKGITYPKISNIGMGIYFSESLDYTSFFGSKKDLYEELINYGNILPLQETFTCIGAEIYYDKTKLKNIYDYSYKIKALEKSPTDEDIKKYLSDKIVEKNGIHLGKFEIESNHILKEEQAGLKRYKGKFIGKEYVITHKEQILPLFGFNFKRSEYVVIWKDRNFTGENKNAVIQLIEKGITNIYTETRLEKSLELIKRKKYNKIILISNVGKDHSGKKFVEIARKILGYNIVVLFYTGKKEHFDWIKDFPNSLGTVNRKHLFEYIEKYNSLFDFKKELSKSYNDMKFNLDDNYFNLWNSKEIENHYKSLIFDGICPNFRKVIIKSKKNKKVLKINNDKTFSFIPYKNLDIDSVVFYVTIIDNKITLNSNGFYLDFDAKENIVKGDTSLKEWEFEEINQKYFIYCKNKNNVLTFSENTPIIKEENENMQNQLFDLIDIIEK